MQSDDGISTHDDFSVFRALREMGGDAISLSKKLSAEFNQKSDPIVHGVTIFCTEKSGYELLVNVSRELDETENQRFEGICKDYSVPVRRIIGPMAKPA